LKEKATHLRIRANLEPVLAEMALAAKVPDRRRVVHANLALLGVVAHPLANVVIAVSAGRRGVNGEDAAGTSGDDSPPDVVGQLKPDDQNALVELACTEEDGSACAVRKGRPARVLKR
jgi:hypothetical protein